MSCRIRAATGGQRRALKRCEVFLQPRVVAVSKCSIGRTNIGHYLTLVRLEFERIPGVAGASVMCTLDTQPPTDSSSVHLHRCKAALERERGRMPYLEASAILVPVAA